MSNSPVNPITVEVVRNGLAHIANEMATVLRKTSYNMMIYEVRDYCVGIVDPDRQYSFAKLRRSADFSRRFWGRRLWMACAPMAGTVFSHGDVAHHEPPLCMRATSQ